MSKLVEKRNSIFLIISSSITVLKINKNKRQCQKVTRVEVFVNWKIFLIYLQDKKQKKLF